MYSYRKAEMGRVMRGWVRSMVLESLGGGARYVSSEELGGTLRRMGLKQNCGEVAARNCQNFMNKMILYKVQPQKSYTKLTMDLAAIKFTSASKSESFYQASYTFKVCKLDNYYYCYYCSSESCNSKRV